MEQFVTIGCAKNARLNPKVEGWSEYAFLREGLDNEYTLRKKFRSGYRDSEILPCFKCGEKPEIVWDKLFGTIVYKIKHRCKPGYKLPPGGSYAVSEVGWMPEVDYEWLRLLWNERQRQLKTTAARAVQLGKL